MIKEAIGTAATIDEAILKAKAALNAPEDADVKIDVLVQPQKKILGLFGGSDAKVKAYYEAADEIHSAPVHEADDSVAAYLKTIVEGMGVKNVAVTSLDSGEERIYEIKTDDDYGVLIGRHGETLDAVQYLVRLFANKKTDSDKRVSVNVGDYREKRNENLKALAQRSANQVLKFGRNVKLEPMNPYERRIVHTAIQGIEGVTSHSVGYDSERRVIITLEDGVEPTVADKRRYNGRGEYNKGGSRPQRGGSSYRRGGSSYRRDSAPQCEQREPRSDFASGTRYGKIEVKKNDESAE